MIGVHGESRLPTFLFSEGAMQAHAGQLCYMAMKSLVVAVCYLYNIARVYHHLLGYCPGS